MAKLKGRRADFVRFYLEGKTGAEAARLAGYSPKSAESRASKLLAQKDVSAAIEKARGEAMEKAKVSAEEVIQGLSKIAFSDSEKVRDKLRALELLGKHLGLFKEKVEIEEEPLTLRGILEDMERRRLEREKGMV